jgi:dCTP deaminase
MILSGMEIKERIGKDIFISDFDESRLNPNSYNLRLGDELVVYKRRVLDMKEVNETEVITIPEEGYVLQPGVLYLARTVEHTETRNLVPMLEGRSSIARLGILVHVSAGFGDVGFKGFWTLELSCVQPVRIYAGVEICQTYYHEVKGDLSIEYHGKYQNNNSVQSSMLYKDFGTEDNKLITLYQPCFFNNGIPIPMTQKAFDTEEIARQEGRDRGYTDEQIYINRITIS